MKKGKAIVHNCHHVSVQNMEKVSQAGDLGSRQKLTLRVIAPDSTLRLGGYYEIEVTGAVSFEGNATGAHTSPVDTALYHPGGPLATPVKGNSGGSLSGESVSLSTPQGSLSTPVGPLYTPVGALTNVQEGPKELRLTLAADILFDFDKLNDSRGCQGGARPGGRDHPIKSQGSG